MIELNEIKNRLIENKNEIIDILKELELETVALEEYKLCIASLNNNNKYIDKNIDIISSYMPMNLPLYSLITYAIVPKICSKIVNYRPSTKTFEQSKKIHQILELDKYNVYLFEGTRNEYLIKKVKNSNAVIFIGKPENANYVREKLSENTMFIYFGVGQNPAIVSDNANIEVASKKIAKTVMFNYGQDCAKPNTILCHKRIYTQFKNMLISEINKNINQKTEIRNSDTFIDISNLLIKDNKYIVYGGTVDFKRKTLDPIIIVKDLKEDVDNYNEYYAPIFRILLYDNISDIKKYFSSKKYKEENMNISLFGDLSYVEQLPTPLILHNMMVPEIDNGYCEYGGYGENTSYLSYKGIKIVKPILINREIKYFYDNETLINNTYIKNEKTMLKKTILKEYSRFIKSNFKNNLSFSYIFGSYAKRQEKALSDVDILVCQTKENNEMVKKFREWYFEYHYMYGKIPDFYYPGELVTEEKLLEIIKKNKDIKFDIYNDSDTFDSLFYTQIFTDKKREIYGNQITLSFYELEFRKFVPDFCNKIYEVLIKKNLIKNERDNAKCLTALAYNDLLFFGTRLNFEQPEKKYDDILEKLDDGFLVKCLRK